MTHRRYAASRVLITWSVSHQQHQNIFSEQTRDVGSESEVWSRDTSPGRCRRLSDHVLLAAPSPWQLSNSQLLLLHCYIIQAACGGRWHNLSSSNREVCFVAVQVNTCSQFPTSSCFITLVPAGSCNNEQRGLNTPANSALWLLKRAGAGSVL